MIVLKYLLNFYINSSIHVALSVYALVRITEFYFGLEYNKELNYFIFFATITGYNFVKYVGVSKFYYKSLAKDIRRIQVFSLVCFCFTCYYGWILPFKTLLFFGFFALLTILYAIPFLGGFQKTLRDVSFLKIFVVALVWSGVTVLIPYYSQKDNFPVEIALQFIQRILFVIALIIPFEIRDVKLDFQYITTLPQKIGLKQAKKVGFVELIFVSSFEFLITEVILFKNLLLVISFITMIFIMRAKENQSSYYSAFWVESIPVFWWLFLLVLSD